MSKKSTDVRQWDQDDISDVKEFLPKGVSFNGLSSSGQQSVEVDIGNARAVSDVVEYASDVEQSFEENGVPVDEVFVKAGYRGAMNTALLFDVRLDE